MSGRHGGDAGDGLIAKYEYTIGRFAEFLNQHGNECRGETAEDVVQCHVYPPRLHGIVYEEGGSWVVAPGYEEFPMRPVTWYGARGACEHGGGRLCRLQEWISACRGPEGYLYPYGGVWCRCCSCLDL